eukprot:scaffold108448_cov38-Tisochrysis_lutea.AAC.1
MVPGLYGAAARDGMGPSWSDGVPCARTAPTSAEAHAARTRRGRGDCNPSHVFLVEMKGSIF